MPTHTLARKPVDPSENQLLDTFLIAIM